MLRTVLILAVLAGCAFMAGWFTIDRGDKETTIRFNRDEIRADASKAIAKGRELLDNGTSQDDGESFLRTELESIGEQLPSSDVFDPQQANRDFAPWQQPAQSGAFGNGQKY